MKIKIKGIFTCASWKWETGDFDECGICCQPFSKPCPKCAIPGDSCPLEWGVCKHVFHKHCVEKWLGDGKHNCPLCRAIWKVATNPKKDVKG